MKYGRFLLNSFGVFGSFHQILIDRRNGLSSRTERQNYRDCKKQRGFLKIPPTVEFETAPLYSPRRTNAWLACPGFIRLPSRAVQISRIY